MASKSKPGVKKTGLRKLDPEQAFVIASMTRSEIAAEFNGIIENEGWETEPFVGDDPRLTDDVCESFVDGMQQASCDVDGLVDREYLYNRACVGSVLGIEVDDG